MQACLFEALAGEITRRPFYQGQYCPVLGNRGGCVRRGIAHAFGCIRRVAVWLIPCLSILRPIFTGEAILIRAVAPFMLRRCFPRVADSHHEQVDTDDGSKHPKDEDSLVPHRIADDAAGKSGQIAGRKHRIHQSDVG